jgi:hypothetical protein
MRLTRFVSALSCALVLIAVPARAQQTAQKPITLAAIIDAMEAREKRTASVSVRWSQHKAFRALFDKPAECTYPSELLLKDDSMRHTCQTFWFRRGGNVTVTLIDHLSTWDGKESRYLQGGTPPAGRILTEIGNTEGKAPHLLALLLYFRPLADPPARVKRKTLKLADGRKTIGGRECVTIDDGHLRADLDCTREFIPVSFETYGRDGRVRYDGTLEYYHEQGTTAWVPKAFAIKLHLVRAGIADRVGGGQNTDQRRIPRRQRVSFALSGRNHCLGRANAGRVSPS